MTTEQRVEVYLRGKGDRANLTPKQRRRAEKKMNRYLSRYWVRIEAPVAEGEYVLNQETVRKLDVTA